MSDDAILTEVREGVLLATFNRPERMNTLSAALTDGLIEMLDFASKSDDVRAVVLVLRQPDGRLATGAGSPPSLCRPSESSRRVSPGWKS